MLALIFAGGEGSRLKLGEKALVTVGGRAMLSHVADAFTNAGDEPVVVTSHKTPFTRNFCRAQGLDFIDTAGVGYVEDLHEAVELSGETGPLFTSAADIPYLTADIISYIRERYFTSGFEACSTWVPLEFCRKYHVHPRYTQEIDGVEATPCTVNIFLGAKLNDEQTELELLLNEPKMAFNVNTREELEAAERLFSEMQSGKR